MSAGVRSPGSDDAGRPQAERAGASVASSRGQTGSGTDAGRGGGGADAETGANAGGARAAPGRTGAGKGRGACCLLRGRLLWFVAEPQGRGDGDSYRYLEDGALLLHDGRIAAVGDWAALRRAHPDAAVTDHRPHLILPGLIDTHLHFPQMQVIASWGAQLLDWLNTYTFPEEARFADPQHAERIAPLFLDELARHGTTTPVVYGSVHATSAEALFAEAARRDQRLVAGKVMMDRNAPDAVLDSAEAGYRDSKALIERWHGQGRLSYAITPRFAITSTPGQLEAAGALMAEHPDCFLQTHLSENAAEIALTLDLYPQAQDYLDVYDRFGLLGPRSLFGHCIHLSRREMGRMAETGSVAVFCPTSNLFLGSGLYDAEGLAAEGVRRAVATDIGGGTNYGLLRTLDEGYKVLMLRGQKMAPLTGFWWATLGNAQALGMETRIGTLEEGTEADLVVLDPAATPAMSLRHERVQSLEEELFLLQVLADDRAVVQTYVAGRPMKGG